MSVGNDKMLVTSNWSKIRSYIDFAQRQIEEAADKSLYTVPVRDRYIATRAAIMCAQNALAAALETLQLSASFDPDLISVLETEQ